MTAASHGTLRGWGLRVDSGSASHVGRVREHNEDHLIANGAVFAVADGLGGHAAGEIASRLVVEGLATLRAQPPQRDEDVGRALAGANRAILVSQEQHPEQRGMGSTVSGLAVVSGEDAVHWLVFNIGDSRVYRVAEGVMSMLTRDHSEVQELLDAGLITSHEAARHPLRNVITRSLGSDPAPDADVWVRDPAEGECFVVCSDGLSNELSDAEILEVVRTCADPQVTADMLVEAAVRAGGRDNVSVVVVAVEALAGEADGPSPARPVALQASESQGS